jgi:hypothetical protein
MRTQTTSKGYTVPETTTTPPVVATAPVVSKAAKAAAAVSDTLPTVVETAEVAMEIPTKVVLNQKLIVTAGVVVGVALGVGATIGWNKFRAHQQTKKLNKAVETLSESEKS